MLNWKFGIGSSEYFMWRGHGFNMGLSLPYADILTRAWYEDPICLHLYTVKWVDGILRQPDRRRSTQVSGWRLFRYADQINPTMKSEYFEGFSTRRNFPTTFRQLSINFLTNETKSKAAPTSFGVTLIFISNRGHTQFYMTGYKQFREDVVVWNGRCPPLNWAQICNGAQLLKM
jgi:hypothetical protein